MRNPPDRFRGHIVRPAKRQDAAHIAPRLGVVDKWEADNLTPGGAEAAILAAFDAGLDETTWTFAREADDEPLAIGGVGPFQFGWPIRHSIWFVSQPLDPEAAFALVALSPHWIDAITEQWSELVNVVPESATETIRWLSKLGVEIEGQSMHPSGQRLLHLCMRRRTTGSKARRRLRT